MMCNATLVSAWHLNCDHGRQHFDALRDHYNVVFTARNTPDVTATCGFGLRSWQATLDTIAILGLLGTYVIAVFVLHVCCVLPLLLYYL